MDGIAHMSARAFSGVMVLLAGLTFNHGLHAIERDGFYAYCVSNLDGTGSCQNAEDNKHFTCLIVPGSIINCPKKSGIGSVDCVWISDIQANQAQFWCDKEDEMAMYEDNPISNDSNREVDPSGSSESSQFPSDLNSSFKESF